MCLGYIFFTGPCQTVFFTVPLPSPNRGKPPILQMALQSPFSFSKVKWRSCLSIFWKPSLICPQLLKPHFNKLLHRYVRWLKTRWASSTGMMPGEGLKSVKNTPSDLPIYTDTNLSLFFMVGQMYFLRFLTYPLTNILYLQILSRRDNFWRQIDA